MNNKPIDWDVYNEPPYLPQWLCQDETLELARFDDGLRNDFENQLRLMVEQYSLEDISGALLDRIGKILDEPRNGNNDNNYRILLKLRILLNTNSGSVNDIIKVLKYFYSSENVHIKQNYPAGISINIFHDDEIPNVASNRMIDAVVAAGVDYDTGELLIFLEHILAAFIENIVVKKNMHDLYGACLRYNGRFLCDQGRMIICNGDLICDGSINCEGVISQIGTVFDYCLHEIYCNGAWICNGERDCSGFEKIFIDEYIQLPILPREYMRDEFMIALCQKTIHDIICFFDTPMRITKRNPIMCDGSKEPTCSLCDGSIICDGSYKEYDGRYYREEITEEVLV